MVSQFWKTNSSVKCGVWKQGRRGWSHERDRKDQEFKNRLCSHNIESESRTQTFMLYAHPSPLCPSQWPKLPSHWRSTSPKTREAKMVFFANFVRFEKHPFPIFACSKSCNSVITHPSSWAVSNTCCSPRNSLSTDIFFRGGGRALGHELNSTKGPNWSFRDPNIQNQSIILNKIKLFPALRRDKGAGHTNGVELSKLGELPIYSFCTFHSFETSYSTFSSFPRSLSSMFWLSVTWWVSSLDLHLWWGCYPHHSLSVTFFTLGPCLCYSAVIKSSSQISHCHWER